jgi:hypothetical protein
MKRFTVSVAWFFVFFFVAPLVDSIVFPVKPSHSGNVDAYEAGAAQGKKHAPFYFIGALVLTVVGMWSGILPGSKRKSESESKQE